MAPCFHQILLSSWRVNYDYSNAYKADPHLCAFHAAHSIDGVAAEEASGKHWHNQNRSLSPYFGEISSAITRTLHQRPHWDPPVVCAQVRSTKIGLAHCDIVFGLYCHHFLREEKKARDFFSPKRIGLRKILWQLNLTDFEPPTCFRGSPLCEPD